MAKIWILNTLIAILFCKMDSLSWYVANVLNPHILITQGICYTSVEPVLGDLLGSLPPLLSVLARKMQMITNPCHPIWTSSSAFGSTQLCIIRYHIPHLLSVSASSHLIAH